LLQADRAANDKSRRQGEGASGRKRHQAFKAISPLSRTPALPLTNKDDGQFDMYKTIPHKTANITLPVIFIMLFLFSSGWSTQNTEKYWFFFTDKGPPCLQKSLLDDAVRSLTERSLKRRAKVAGLNGHLVDQTDIAVFQPYIEELRSIGIEALVISKWLNAVSGRATKAQINEAHQFPFVIKTQRVAIWSRRTPPVEKPPAIPLHKWSGSYLLNYGVSLTQNELIRVPDVHELGIHGEGVLIAVFDTGFQLQHEAFDYLNVVAEWDFINGDGNTANNSTQDRSSQYHHGTSVLSIIAGYAPGKLIGPAFGADYILAKTEDVSSETSAEEDNWIAAAEWADSLGADVITSSVGYMDWYTQNDLDGNTAPITIAADLAVKKGIVVCNSAGNEGSYEWRIVIAPADGDSVIAVGAVDSKGNVVGFSSRGPTADDRIKPDVMAQGSGVYAVTSPISSEDSNHYSYKDGTSVSCPQVAGVAALVLCAQPDLTPVQVREALRQTADKAHHPDNDYGWGLVDALSAVKYWGDPPSLPQTHRLHPAKPNPFYAAKDVRSAVTFDMSNREYMSLEIYNILGHKVRTLWQGERMAGARQRLSWNGLSDNGQTLPSGVYLIQLKVGNEVETVKITLLR